MILTFKEALNKSSACSVRHLVLGNGFSIACVPSIFTYTSLYEQVDFKDFAEIKKVFGLLNTTDFELVIHALENASFVLPAYFDDSANVCGKINSHSHRLKELLIETIAANHPPFPSEIENKKFESCRRFLSHFVNNNSNGKIYTLNYDLLLYWTLMHETIGEDFELTHNDGFGRDSWFDDGEAFTSDELIWQGKNDKQNVHYMHGGLHLFNGKGRLEKFSWIDTGQRLIEQSKKALEEDKFPLFVTEGDSEKKINKIANSPYLFNSYKSFEAVANGGKGKVGNTCIFTYGVSFSDNDSHIFEKIANGKIKTLYVSIFGDENSHENQKIIRIAQSLASRRSKFPLEVFFYDAQSANVWGN